MKKELSTPLVVVIVVAAVAVVGLIGYRALGGTKSSMTPEEQKESMRHMIPAKP